MPGSEGGPSLAYQNLGNDPPTHLVWRVFKHSWETFKKPAGVHPNRPYRVKNQLPKGLAWVMPHDPFPLQNLDKNRPKSSQNFTPILWLVQITTHYKEQLLQNQGEFMVKKGPLESKEDLEGHNRASLTVYSAYLSAYCNNFRVQQLLIFIHFVIVSIWIL